MRAEPENNNAGEGGRFLTGFAHRYEIDIVVYLAHLP